jgi:hypothetical protein
MDYYYRGRLSMLWWRWRYAIIVIVIFVFRSWSSVRKASSLLGLVMLCGSDGNRTIAGGI